MPSLLPNQQPRLRPERFPIAPKIVRRGNLRLALDRQRRQVRQVQNRQNEDPQICADWFVGPSLWDPLPVYLRRLALSYEELIPAQCSAEEWQIGLGDPTQQLVRVVRRRHS